MKKTTKWLQSVVAILLLGGASVLGFGAEPSAVGPAGGTNLVAKISEKLGLTEDQKAKVEPILRVSFEKRRAVLEKYRGRTGLKALRSLRAELKPIRKDTDDQLKGILTKEQMKRFEKLRDEMKDELRDEIRERRKHSD